MEALSVAVDENGEKFNKALIFDEAHKFMSKSSPIREQVGSAIKEMRHRGMWVVTDAAPTTTSPSPAKQTLPLPSLPLVA
jgi:hypothetical protein